MPNILKRKSIWVIRKLYNLKTYESNIITEFPIYRYQLYLHENKPTYIVVLGSRISPYSRICSES